MIKLGAKELRKSKPSKKDLAKIERNPIYIVLDNVLDTYNVGAIFRMADAVAAKEVILCGETATPEDAKVGHKIEKASVGTWRWVKWRHCQSAVEAVREIRDRTDRTYKTNKKVKIVAVEQDARSIAYNQAEYELPLAIVVGHETEGVSQKVLDEADMIVELPLWGVNKSLNVMVSLAIVLYKVMERW